MFHQPHSTVFRPALSIVISNNILVIWIRILSQIPLNQLSCLVFGEFEEYVEMIYISKIYSDGMLGLKLNGFVYHKLVLVISRSSYFVRSVQTHDQNIDYQTIELEDKWGEL